MHITTRGFMETKPSTIVGNYFEIADTAPEAFADNANVMRGEGIVCRSKG
jgi:hypothetical protein